ncbi:hypothetical protein KJ365_13325 [Glaciecola sp. XM2]|uniref:hypothetical protein n=1 Tax=Glaciecola sp. XM2 TaxID=1914931 RepID=UPI001BDF1FE1|nr:hypothetical protein [Glaciecola sp. XM2]MBT1451868.1 hypothetical protein [Glaciecola sp. XM2]
MKRLIGAMIIGLAFTAIADDKPVADLELILDLKQFCEDIAESEGTDGKPLPEFLLACVNEELELEGFQAITKLPE